MSLPTFHSEDVDIVCFSLLRWSSPISSPAASLAKEFAKTHRVFFIEHPYSYKDALLGERPKTAGSAEGVVIVQPPLVWPVNFLPEGFLYNFASGFNQKILENTLRHVIKKQGIRKYVFINFFDPFFLGAIAADIAPAKYVYQCMDDLSQVAYTSRHGIRLENEIIKKADLVLCTSRELTRIKSAYSDKVRFHPNAADFALFNTAVTNSYPRPADLDFGSKKVIGFTGSIEYRTDFELLKMLAARHSDKIIFLLGPVSGNEHVAAGLHHLKNVVFAGARKLEELPAYLQYFDCCIIPYKKNKLTASIYPLKINEYLAAGKPVVATRFSEDITSFERVAYLADTNEEFVTAIDRAIEEDDSQRRATRIEVASANTWQNRVKQFWQLLT